MLTGKVVMLLGIGCALILASAKDADAYPNPLPPSINLAVGINTSWAKFTQLYPRATPISHNM
jgi:hypothetical protein